MGQLPIKCTTDYYTIFFFPPAPFDQPIPCEVRSVPAAPLLSGFSDRLSFKRPPPIYVQTGAAKHLHHDSLPLSVPFGIFTGQTNHILTNPTSPIWFDVNLIKLHQQPPPSPPGLFCGGDSPATHTPLDTGPSVWPPVGLTTSCTSGEAPCATAASASNPR